MKGQPSLNKAESSIAGTSPRRVLLRTESTANGEAGGTSREIRLANVRAKVKALSGKNLRAFDAITDLIAEASLNKASLLDARRAPLELVKLLSLPTAQRRATTYRDLCELGRNLHLPSWHGSERRHLYVWYHCMHRLRLVEVESGSPLMRQGEMGDTMYWLLTGTMEEYKTGPPPATPPKSPVRTSMARNLSTSTDRRTGTGAGDGAAAAATGEEAAAAGHPPGTSLGAGGERSVSTPPLAASASGSASAPRSSSPTLTSPRHHQKRVKVLERLGQEALQGNPYTVNVEATSECQLAALSRSDYQAVVALAARESFEGLRAMSSLLSNKSNRHPKALADLASLLSVTEMFRAMDPEFRSELCGLLEFLALPEGTILFEEGDKVDFTYVILKGEVVLSRYNEARMLSEDFAVKTTGQQFGSLSALQVGAAAAAAAGASGGAVAAAVANTAGADKKRNFSARCTQLTEFAIVTKVGYTRLIRGQLQKSLNTRLALLQGMAIMSSSANQTTLTRIAINCQDETFSAGTVLVDPACPPTRLFFIVEGQAKMLWVADSPGQAPPVFDRSLDGGPCGAVSVSGSVGGPTGGGSSGPEGGLSGAALSRDGRSLKRRQQPFVYELALLSRGDVVNGMVLHGKTSCFTVVAATNLKVMSLEAAGGVVALEQLFGKEQAAMLRELVLLQAEVHRERAARMVAVRQNSALLMDHRIAAAAVGPSVAESATFLQHYVPKTPGLEALSSAHPTGYVAAAVRDASLFVPGAVQHGDVMKLVAAVGTPLLDNLPSPTSSPLPPSRRAGTSSGGVPPSASAAFASNGGGGGGHSSSQLSFTSAQSQRSMNPSHHHHQQQQQQQQLNRDNYLQRDQSAAQLTSLLLQTPQSHSQSQSRSHPRGPSPPDQHVTTVVAQPVAIPRTRMRVPSPGMARELGLEAPPPPLGLQASYGNLDRVSSLGLLPDPAGGKSRNGRPRAPHRMQLGLPFAGNVAMLVLENHSDLVKVVTPSPSSLDCIATLRQANNVSYCDDDGQCDEAVAPQTGASGESYRSYADVGHSVTVFSAEPASGPSGTPSSLTAPTEASEPQTPLAVYPLPYNDAEAAGADTHTSDDGDGGDGDGDGGGGGGGSAAADVAVPSDSSDAPQGLPVASTDGAPSVEACLSPSSSCSGAADRTEGASPQDDDEAGPLTPFSSMPLALAVIDSDDGGGGGGGSRGSRGGSDDAVGTPSGLASEPSWRGPRTTLGSQSQSSYFMGSQSSPLLHVEPLTLAASQSQSALTAQQSSAASLGGVGTASAAALTTMPSARAAAAMLCASSTPLAAGQVHVPPLNVYRRLAPAVAAGAQGTAGAMPTPVLAATAVVQPVVSAETAKLCASRLATIMSTGPLAAAEAAAATAGNATEAAAAAAHAAVRAAALAAGLAPSPVPQSSGASLPPSTASSYTRDYVPHASSRLARASSPHDDDADASPSRLAGRPPSMAAAAASSDNVVIMPRMVVYETALLDVTAGAAASGGGGGGLCSPRGNGGNAGSVSPGNRVRLTSLGPEAAASAAAAASAPVHATPGSTAVNGGHSTYVLLALPAAAAAAPLPSPAASAAWGAAAAAATTASAAEGPRLRQPPRLLRSLDTAVVPQNAVSRELLGYYSSSPRLGTDAEDGGMVFTGGIGGRSVRYGSGGPGSQRRQGVSGAGGGASGAATRIGGGVSLRDLAGVNGVRQDGAGGRGRGGGAMQKAQEGPDLPLELDTEAPPLQNRKLSEPSLDDLKYILTRWSTKWSQERNVLGTPSTGVRPGHVGAPYPQSEPSSPARGGGTPDLSRFGYTSEDLYRMAREQAEAVGVGAFKRPFTQLDLFGLPYIGGTPRPDVAEGQQHAKGRASASAIAAGAGYGGGAPLSNLSGRSGGA